MPDSADALYEKVCQHARETALLSSIEALLGWDERCLMPAAAAEYRAEQMTLLSGMMHSRQTDPQLGEWLGALAEAASAAEPASDRGATLRQLKRQFDKKTRLPKKLVEELTRTSVLGQQAWQNAKESNDYGSFAPLLKKTIELKREQAEAVGYAECPYDALLDDFEPNELTSNLQRVLGGLRDELTPLVAAIRDSGRQADISLLKRRFPVAAQEAFGRRAAAAIGFDFERGRLDVTAHPFCTAPG
ncbi:MAG TPA: carboxypeptidase M32, partial [Pirellulales bacterium]|nr:carboxypeptidase M32 [Pirellulales bacterium]